MDDPAALLNEILPEGWEHDAETFGFDFTLVCPHGHTIEADGECPEGCGSPLVELGIM